MRRAQRAFTLIELMIVVAIIGILAAVAIPSLIKYIRRSKTIEATMNLRKIYDSSVAYYEAERATATAACCGQKGDRCVPAPTNFADDTWTVLHFSVDDPFYYVYQYTTSGADTSATFGAWAFGDLDCDSIQSTFERSGSVMADRSVTGAAGLFSKNDNE